MATRKGTMRQSQALGEVMVVTLDDVADVDSTNMEDVRVLVTTHSLAPVFKNTVEKGLGFWVFYIIQQYMVKRNIPCKLYVKSIVYDEHAGIFGIRGASSKDDIIKFIKRNKIDILVPSDVTDTQFFAKYYDEFSPLCKMAVTPDLKVYETLEDKWETAQFCEKHSIASPKTELLEGSEIAKSFPFFLKVASGTNAGRGVWLIKDQEQLDKTLALKSNKAEGVVLLAQKPTFGRIVCGEIIYNKGRPIGFFFAASVQADDLAGMGTKYIFSFANDGYSHEKVELEEKQWQMITKIFKQIGDATKYHGMIDIEFIVAGPGNEGVEEGSVWLLECNPRFSGDIHTTLSNLGFLDQYFDLCCGRISDRMPTKNFSRGVEMQSEFKSFNPTPFFMKHPRTVVGARNWGADVYVTVQGDPSRGKKKNKKGAAATTKEDNTAAATEVETTPATGTRRKSALLAGTLATMDEEDDEEESTEVKETAETKETETK